MSGLNSSYQSYRIFARPKKAHNNQYNSYHGVELSMEYME